MTFDTVNPQQARDLMQSKKYVYLDVRSEPEFAEGHAEGAFNVPILNMSGGGMAPNADFLKVVMARFPRETPLVVGCKMGGRSARACEILAANGYGDVKNIDGGFSGNPGSGDPIARRGWSGAGLPVSKTPAPGASYSSLKSKA